MPAPRSSRVGLFELVRRANLPLAPEHSVTFRLSTAVAVLTGIVACASVGELSVATSAIACVASGSGMLFSYLTRRRPMLWVKIALAIAVLGVFGAFVEQVVSAAHTGQLSSIEVPLAGLFTWVQVIHAVDVPARRDLLFSLAAAGALITVGAAQAVSGDFVAFVAVWLASTLVALSCSWRSMTGGTGRLAIGSVVASALGIVVVGTGLLTVLPTPRAAQAITLPASLTSYLPIASPGTLTGGGAQPTEPAHAGIPGGRIGVGGYLGFASALDTGLRGSLGNQVVLRVRADRPGYFLGMTYDTWDGQSWTRSKASTALEVLSTGSPFDVTQALMDLALSHQAPSRKGSLGTGYSFTLSGGGSTGSANVQTFYVAAPLANLLFATSQPTEVYFPAHSLVVGADGSIRSTVAMTPGTVYTVISADQQQSPSVLARVKASMSPAVLAADLQLPRPYRAVHALALRIVGDARARTTYTKVAALESWMSRNVTYSTDIPPLLPGQDAVDQFLFHNRVGYCEQISTALTVMLRTLHVPAREAIGYVPGPFDPLSDLYEIQAKDAHAWVQVYFPGYGWQSFDPTADVPLGPPDPGAVLLADIGRSIRSLPRVPIGGGLAFAAFSILIVAWRRRRASRPATWPERLVLSLEQRGRRAGVPRLEPETLSEYATRLYERGRWRPGSTSPETLRAAVKVLEHAAYAPRADAVQLDDGSIERFVAAAVRGLKPHRRAARIHARSFAGASAARRPPYGLTSV